MKTWLGELVKFSATRHKHQACFFCDEVPQNGALWVSWKAENGAACDCCPACIEAINQRLKAAE